MISGGGTVTWFDAIPVPFVVTQEVVLIVGTSRPQAGFVLRPRIANLHAGMAWMSNDFDAPLPEDFLIRDE